ncbi:MAG TPA: STAS domain-containing protein [Candidatus Baltobacteraceae bacterium]|nr:STAS domain-containing protein [Candidatus Baltobacteraceae bacterium]
MAISAGVAVHETTASSENIHVFGDVDEYNAAEFEDALQRVLALSRPITVDLTRCRYIGSVGLRALLRAKRLASSGFTTLVNAESVAARLLEIAKVEETLGVRRISRAHTGSIQTEDARGHVRIITLQGEWDLSRGHELRRHIDRTLEHPRAVIDLTAVSYIDSHCIGMLVRMRTQRVAKGYEPSRLVLKSGNVRRVLGLVGVHTLWTIYESLDEALADWKQPGNISAANLT